MVTNSDFIRLVATYNDLTNGSKTKMDPRLAAKGYTEAQLAHANKNFVATFSPVTSCGLRFTKPFAHLKFEPISYVLTLLENYERGCLPFPGSVSEQPSQIMELFSILSQLKHEAETRAREQQKQKVSPKQSSPRRK